MAKQKNVIPSGMTEYCRVMIDGFKNALCTAHFAHEHQFKKVHDPQTYYRTAASGLPALRSTAWRMAAEGTWSLRPSLHSKMAASRRK